MKFKAKIDYVVDNQYCSNLLQLVIS